MTELEKTVKALNTVMLDIALRSDGIDGKTGLVVVDDILHDIRKKDWDSVERYSKKYPETTAMLLSSTILEWGMDK